MRPTLVTLAISAAVALAGCSQGSADVAGARVPAENAPAAAPLYAPVDRTALIFGLPELVQGIRLEPSTEDAVAADEAAFARDLIVKPTSAIWVKGLPAELLAEFDPSFYLLQTSVTTDQYRWEGEKPSRERSTILDRELWSSDWGRFQLVWYAWGEVLYVVLAENQQLLEATLRQMPWPSDTA